MKDEKWEFWQGLENAVCSMLDWHVQNSNGNFVLPNPLWWKKVQRWRRYGSVFAAENQPEEVERAIDEEDREQGGMSRGERHGAVSVIPFLVQRIEELEKQVKMLQDKQKPI